MKRRLFKITWDSTVLLYSSWGLCCFYGIILYDRKAKEKIEISSSKVWSLSVLPEHCKNRVKSDNLSQNYLLHQFQYYFLLFLLVRCTFFHNPYLIPTSYKTELLAEWRQLLCFLICFNNTLMTLIFRIIINAYKQHFLIILYLVDIFSFINLINRILSAFIIFQF